MSEKLFLDIAVFYWLICDLSNPLNLSIKLWQFFSIYHIFIPPPQKKLQIAPTDSVIAIVNDHCQSTTGLKHVTKCDFV